MERDKRGKPPHISSMHEFVSVCVNVCTVSVNVILSTYRCAFPF